MMPDNNKQLGHGGRRKAYSNEVKNKDYLSKRARNNMAVKKCRAQARKNAKETYAKVGTLKLENARLEMQINETESQLAFLKQILQRNPVPMDNFEENLRFEELMRDLDAEIGGQ